MNSYYRGTIVEESLEDNRILNDFHFKILRLKISSEDNPADRWHIYTVRIQDENDIERLAQHIKPGWYMHFWRDDEVIAIFKDKTFKFKYSDKSTWEPAIEYGRSVGIPAEQLDFPIA